MGTECTKMYDERAVISLQVNIDHMHRNAECYLQNT